MTVFCDLHFSKISKPRFLTQSRRAAKKNIKSWRLGDFALNLREFRRGNLNSQFTYALVTNICLDASSSHNYDEINHGDFTCYDSRP